MQKPIATTNVTIDVPDLERGVAFCCDPFGHGFCVIEE